MIRTVIILTCCLFIAPVFSNTDIEAEAKEEFFPSTPEQVATLSSEPSYLIGGLISPLSGQPCLRQTDCIVKGAQNIILSRIYIPPYMPCSFPRHSHTSGDWDNYNLYQHLAQNYKGWQFFPHLKLQFSPRQRLVLLTDPNGMTLNYRLSGPNNSVTTLETPPNAISNTVGDTPSGKYDPRNTRISYEDNGNKITVYAPDGVTRFYYKTKWAIKNDLLYLLEKETLPNGKILRYHYDSKNQPDYVESLDPKERFVYASIRISGSPWEGNCHFTSSSGLTTDYNYERRKISGKIKKTHLYQSGNGKMEQKFNFTCPPILTSSSSPSYHHESLKNSGQFLLESYSGKDYIFNASYTGFGEGVPHYRVNKLFLPVGPNDAMIPVYELSYLMAVTGLKERTTTVRNSDGTSIIYHFSRELLTTSIQYFGPDGNRRKEKNFYWDKNNWLIRVELIGGIESHHRRLYRKTYDYDRFGNPILEIFEGDFLGKFTTKRTFSEDGKNLLLREESEDGKVVCFSYLPNTNLVTSKLTKDGDKIILREFAVYDDCNNLIQQISDDGATEDKDNLSNVTQRTVMTYRLRQSAPFLHMPEWIEETYWEGIEKPLKKSHLIYDQHGNVAQEEVYDAEGKLRFTICKTYNERGDVLTETNRLEQQAIYTYDPRGRLETSTNFSHRLQTTFCHDTKGRLKGLTEKGDDGIDHIFSFEYDPQDRKIEKSDSFQNVTHYP
jgi:YD repeat-containing protein